MATGADAADKVHAAITKGFGGFRRGGVAVSLRIGAGYVAG